VVAEIIRLITEPTLALSRDKKTIMCFTYSNRGADNLAPGNNAVLAVKHIEDIGIVSSSNFYTIRKNQQSTYGQQLVQRTRATAGHISVQL
jgi:hypothetical protein